MGLAATAVAIDPTRPYAGRAPDTMWTYKQVDGNDLQLSVFLPQDYDTGQRFPAILFFHGGSWNNGDPNWHYPDCAYWSGRGMIAVSVRYRLRDRDKVDVPLECVKDAKSAIRYLRKNAAALKVDPQRIVAAGGSAGAQLAAATAMITAADTNDDVDDLSIPCAPNAVILYNAWLKCQASLSPLQHVQPGLPPLVMFHGDQDPTPVPEMLAFQRALAEAGNVAELYVGHGGQHGFCNGRNPANRYFYWALELADRFLVRQRILDGTDNVQRPPGLPAVTFDETRSPGQ